MHTHTHTLFCFLYRQEEGTAKSISEARATRNRSRTRKKIKEDASNSEIISNSDSKTDLNETPNTENTSDNLSNSKSMPELSSDLMGNNTELPNIRNLKVKLRPLRSSELRSTANTKSTKSNDSMPLEKQNGIIPSQMDIRSFCSSDIQTSLKECNVSLRKDEVEKYIALNNSNSDSLDENCISDDDFQQMSLRDKNKSNVTHTSAPSKKRQVYIVSLFFILILYIFSPWRCLLKETSITYIVLFKSIVCHTIPLLKHFFATVNLNQFSSKTVL